MTVSFLNLHKARQVLSLEPLPIAASKATHSAPCRVWTHSACVSTYSKPIDTEGDLPNENVNLDIITTCCYIGGRCRFW
jgi:hypothetical protein